jgi:diaminopimelate epimerase
MPEPRVLEWGSIYLVDTGVPHLVVWTEALSAVDVAGQGKRLRQQYDANVTFVQQVAPTVLKVRIYERGVEGETEACGSGSLAAAFVAHRLGRIPTALVTVGPHEVAIEERGLSLLGHATFVFEGALL